MQYLASKSGVDADDMNVAFSVEDCLTLNKEDLRKCLSELVAGIAKESEQDFLDTFLGEFDGLAEIEIKKK